MHCLPFPLSLSTYLQENQLKKKGSVAFSCIFPLAPLFATIGTARMTASYAILGATGSTGQNLLKLLASSSENDINVYVRSRSKLEAMFPSIVKQSNVHIFDGNLQDKDLIRRCVETVTTVFAVVASNTNARNTSVAQDSARVLVEVFERIRIDNSSAKLPRILFLSSCSVSQSIQGQNRIGHWLVHKALCNIYGDLIKAEAYLRQHQSWINVIFIQPGVLSTDLIQRGHVLSTTDAGSGGFLSYIDLAAGMIDVAQAGDRYDWQGVVVQPTTPASFDWRAPYNVLYGLGIYVTQLLY